MIKRALHRVAWRLEKLVDRLAVRRNARRMIEPYLGYATPEHLIVRGRVLTSLRRSQPKPTQSKWTNFKQMLALFFTAEVSGVEVAAEGVTAVSDAEGYFTILLPRGAQTGVTDITVTIPDQTTQAICPVFVADPNAAFIVISDIDDTMLQTGAYSLVKNLWTSLTGNINTRNIFPDSVDLMTALSKGGQNPIYYVSSSPWNLFHFLLSIFERSGLVRGPMFLRDLGISEQQFIAGSHGDHKGASIDVILAAHPDLNAILVGDTGQHDAFVYHDAIERHPGRMMAVVLREPGPGPDEESRHTMELIAAAGIPLLHAPTFDGFAGQLDNLVGQAMGRSPEPPVDART